MPRPRTGGGRHEGPTICALCAGEFLFFLLLAALQVMHIYWMYLVRASLDSASVGAGERCASADVARCARVGEGAGILIRSPRLWRLQSSTKACRAIHAK